ncbi:GH1 family beta-glucosidase [Nocardioides insulae]|uniref:GH1 family beta-glucosidase n=1 Tax=Nocardioides insulae TaxID=394734 RepID=UPI00041A62B5|nr:GH1 family beta-glucosidase [Nocardioides insulae]
MSTTSTTRQQPGTALADLRFPPGFLWGAATASYQIEGAVDVDGRSPSVWDTFARVPGAVLGGDTGDIACDHYHRYREDVALMKRLGLDSYRFSVAWPRVRPDGGAVDQRGLDFYRRLVDELLEHDIAPWVTLYHWDLPQALEDAGGWTRRDTAYRFLDYALSVYDALGDRVPYWTTLNEPFCSAFLGYTGGQHAPGRQDGVAGMVAAHHLLLGHGLAAEALRERGVGQDGTRLGLTLNFTVPDPFDPEDELDRDAARRVDGQFNRLFADAVLLGRYPEDIVADTTPLDWQGGSWTDVIEDGDLSLISAPLDVLGVNYYQGNAVSGRPQDDEAGTAAAQPSRPTASQFVAGEDITFPRRDLPVTGLDWEVQPDGLTRLLRRLATDYDVPPMYITENGAAYPDTVSADGGVHDAERTAYVVDHLRAVHAAIQEGVDVRGYFAWSLLDNFEWAYGYDQRFGLVYVDYETQERIPKDSALAYARIAAEQRGTRP